MYKVILLDADGTILDFQKTEEVAFKQVLEKYKIEYTPNIFEIYKHINSKLWIDLEKGIIEKNVLKYERFKLFFEAINVVGSGEEAGKHFIEGLKKGNFLLDGAVSLCQKLYAKYKVIILTNGITDVQISRIGKSEISNLYHELVISGEVGFSKPDPRIFEYALQKVGHMDKSSVLMVGDSCSADIIGGINFGIDTCYMNLRDERLPDDVEATYTVTSLKMLEDLL